MNNFFVRALVLSVAVLSLATLTISAITPLNNLTETSDESPTEDSRPSLSESRAYLFPNPLVSRFEGGCYTASINANRFGPGVSLSDRMQFCQALERMTGTLNQTAWSSELRDELLAIWDVFLNENVKIQTMKKGVSRRVAALAEAYIPDSRNNHRFRATLYLRPRQTKKKAFFLMAMHELRHVYDFYKIWQTERGITKAELEKRGFRIMGRIARETSRKEKFSRLPKVWDDKWRGKSESYIASTMDARINNYMRKSRFYRDAMRNPNKHFIGKRTRRTIRPERLNIPVLAATGAGAGARLPYLVRTKHRTELLAQNVKDVSFDVARADNTTSPSELLHAAIRNEKKLHFQMDNFVYDQDLQIQCWKKKKVSESYIKTMQVARTGKGQPLFDHENVTIKSKKKKAIRTKVPTCLLNMESINTDSTETFWSAPYLEDMNVKFNYFTEIEGTKVARYTVHKPSHRKFNEIATKYPFVKPFRVFFGTIFVSVEDAQIVKFWGSSYPEAGTTGLASKRSHASYNATAVRQKLSSGIWVTTKLNTVAVANKRGKMKPFSYVVNYKNYRQTTSDVMILDDEESVAGID